MADLFYEVTTEFAVPQPLFRVARRSKVKLQDVLILGSHRRLQIIEQTDQAKESAVDINRVGTSSAPVFLLHIADAADFQSECIQGIQIAVVPEVKTLCKKRLLDEVQEFVEHPEHKIPFGSGICFIEQLECVGHLEQAIGIVSYAGVNHGEVGIVKVSWDDLDTAEIQHTELPIGGHQEIAGMRIGVNFPQYMQLIVGEVPKRLTDLIPNLVRWIGLHELPHVHSFQPIHRQYPLT